MLESKDNFDYMETKKDKKTSGVAVWLKLLIVFIMAFFFIGVGVLMVAVDRPEYSESEGRKLKEFPSFSFKAFFSGEYFSDLQEYYDDTVPMRETFKLTSSRIRNYKGTSDVVIIIPNRPTADPSESQSTPLPEPTPTPEPTPVITLEPGQTPTPTPVPTPTPTPSPTPDDGDGEFEYSTNGIVFYRDRALELYGGSKTRMNEYVAALNKLQERMPNVSVYSMTIPIAAAYYLPSQYSSYSSAQLPDIEYINNLLSPSIKRIDAYNALYNHRGENIYLKTDHHWTTLGAYYCAQEFAKVAGVSFTDISAYERVDRSNYLGSFYAYYKVNALANHPEVFTTYKPRSSYQIQYYDRANMEPLSYPSQMFADNASDPYWGILHGDEYIVRITANNNTGRKLAIFGDSFPRILPPFFVDSFDEVIIIDIRYIRVDAYDLIADNGITDVLCSSCVFTNAGPNAASYTRIFNS